MERAPAAEVVARPDEHADLIPEPGRIALANGRALERADLEAAAAARLGIALVGLGDPRYPILLPRISDPPPVLYVRGTLVAEDDVTDTEALEDLSVQDAEQIKGGSLSGIHQVTDVTLKRGVIG